MLRIKQADREFPESARTLALHGAELILTPNACGLVDAQLRQFQTRAIENVLGVRALSSCMPCFWFAREDAFKTKKKRDQADTPCGTMLCDPIRK
jgi:hypothetical protein